MTKEEGEKIKEKRRSNHWTYSSRIKPKSILFKNILSKQFTTMQENIASNGLKTED